MKSDISCAISSASAWLPLVMTSTVAPTSATSAYAKPNATETNTSGARSSQIRARSMISIAGETPVPWNTLGVITPGLRVALAGL